MAKAPKSLAGSVVAITGGARGIGRATASELIARGARVAIGDLDAALAEKTASELGAGTLGLALDVTQRPSFEAFLTEVEERLGPLDVLVNNAGIMPIGPFAKESDATADRIIDINVRGVIIGSKLALARFLPRRRGHLVNVASIAGKGPAPNGATYSASKHAIVGLTESLRQELRGSGIDLTLVMPVGVNTELYSGTKQLRGVRTPEPEDVARAIVEAVQHGRFEVFVPRFMKQVVQSSSLLPGPAFDALAGLLGVNQALASPDPVERAAYEARMRELIDRQQAPPAESAQPAAPEPSSVAGEGPAD